jgi:hypothetical protein
MSSKIWEKPILAFSLSLIGAILILANGLWIASNKEPLIFSSPISQYSSLAKNPGIFWGRIALGIKGMVEGTFMPLWLFLSIIILFAALMIYISPQHRNIWGTIAILLSIFTIPIGGGFILGLILVLIGGDAAIEWPKSLADTFFGKILRAIRFDSKLYREISENIKTTRQAAMTLLFAGLLSGIGQGSYIYNVFRMQSDPSLIDRVLLSGVTFWDFSLVAPAVEYIGYSLIRWLILTLIIYLVGVKLLGYTTSFDSMARTMAYAYFPMGLQVFLLLVFTGGTWLTVQWPITILSLTYFWTVLTLTMGVKQSVKLSIRKSLGVVFISFMIFWLFDSILAETLKVPRIQILIMPTELMLTALGLLTILGVLLDVFSRR